jgi:hypothetical protein
MLPQERKDLVEWFLEIKNDDKVKNKYEFVSKKFEEKYKKPAPHRNFIRYNINKWDKFATLETRQKGTPHRRPVLTENNINLVNDFVKNSKDFISVRDIERGTGIKRQSVHNILTQELKLFPYKVLIGQKLSPNSEVKRKKFSEIMLEKIESDPRYLDNIWFTDESHFHLDGYVNKQILYDTFSSRKRAVL